MSVSERHAPLEAGLYPMEPRLHWNRSRGLKPPGYMRFWSPLRL